MLYASWNVFGLGKYSRLQKVRKWIREQKDLDVLMLQELRIREQMTERRLLELAETYNFVADYTVEGKAGAAVVLLNKNWRVIEKGVKGDGFLAWMVVETEDGPLGLVSVHGPRDRNQRKHAWEWMENKWPKGRWVLGGDWNSVETPADSVGSSPIQLGGERRKWQSLLAHQDLEDGWLVASKREGPHFTRQQTVGGRIDQARLDRIYFTPCEQWADLQIIATHDTKGRLSDHKPVVLSIKKEELKGTRKSTYFKVSPETLQHEETMEAARKTWHEAGKPGDDPRRNWDWKWGETRRVLMARAKHERETRQVVQGRLEELNKKRAEIAVNRTSVPDQQLLDLEEEIKLLERQQETAWRRWSRTRWIKEGDMPSKFFFSLLKAKRASQSITLIKTDDGRQLTKEEDIVKELAKFYMTLFKQEEISEREQNLRNEVLRTTTKRLNESQNRRLSREPDLEEVHGVIEKLPTDKSPGLDGMTVESLKALGETPVADLLAVALAFWRGEKITWKQQQGVIILIPKEGERHLIKNWRPISLLNLGYKLLAKILANILKELLPELIDSQQKVFVQGRSISDSVMAFKIGQEWCLKSKQKALFVKLDFEKAYDRVGHQYLWQTMEAMNISPKFIALTKGLIEGTTSKLHVAGTFSREIPLERGVRQGCPLAPLLFSIATQPLMLILRMKEREGKLHGLQITGQKTLLHNLFADDSGVTIRAEQEDFQELQEAIRCYECISGAKLNLKKSTVIPLGLSEVPDWLTRTGCHIAKKGEIIRYLGFPIGWGISEDDQKAYVTSKMKKKLGSWKYKLLSFTGRLVALQHVVRSTPVHLLACLNLQKQAMDELEAISRCFLWGQNNEGRPKIPMVAWEVVLKTKKAGGLGLTAFRELSLAMRTKQLTKLFTHQEEEWVGAAEQLIRSVNKGGREGRERQTWSIQEIVLLQPPKRIPAAPTTSGLLDCWHKIREKLKLDDTVQLSSTMPTTKALMLAEAQGWIPREGRMQAQQLARQHKLATLTEWCDWRKETAEGRELTGTWESTIELGNLQGIQLHERQWCNREKETLEHLLIDCTDSQTIWAEWQTKTRRTDLHWNQTGDFIEMIDEAWRDQNWAKVTLLIKCTWRTWLDRNAITYNAQRRRTPLKVSAMQAEYTLKAILQSTDEKSNKFPKLESAVKLIGETFMNPDDQPRDSIQSLDENTEATHSLVANEELAPSPTNQLTT
ncbi:hypothetical protein R1sor_014394 [Riccia sorocarpa]|uniref:Reverse transcriptase domain-containing protein n=1 Tax=Riccia sorocarpa TaxID=122646 RepID=A0ABD3HD32_9MARC